MLQAVRYYCAVRWLTVPGLIFCTLVRILGVIIPRKTLFYMYGSLWIGYIARVLPLSSRIMANYFEQIPDSMEAAGTVTDVSWFRVAGIILIPLQGYGIISTRLICFPFCIGELGTTILAYPPGKVILLQVFDGNTIIIRLKLIYL